MAKLIKIFDLILRSMAYQLRVTRPSFPLALYHLTIPVIAGYLIPDTYMYRIEEKMINYDNNAGRLYFTT